MQRGTVVALLEDASLRFIQPWLFTFVYKFVSFSAEKRFHYPGNKRASDSEETPAVSNYAHSRLKTQRFDGEKSKKLILVHTS